MVKPDWLMMAGASTEQMVALNAIAEREKVDLADLINEAIVLVIEKHNLDKSGIR